MSNKSLILGALAVTGGLIIFASFYGSSPSQNRALVGHQAALGNAGGNSQAPDFSLAKLGGGIISLADYRGKKPVVVDFWASWCPNCRRDMPHLNNFYEKYKDKFEVVAVNLQEDDSTVRNFVNSQRFSFIVALDPSGQASHAYGIQYTNTHFLINKEGQLVRVIPGDISESDIQSLIQ